MQRTFCRRLTCIARPLASAFEIISKLGTIGTLHNIHAQFLHLHITSQRKSRQQIYNAELLIFTAHERFTFIGYCVTKLLKKFLPPVVQMQCVKINHMPSDSVRHTCTIPISVTMGICFFLSFFKHVTEKV